MCKDCLGRFADQKPAPRRPEARVQKCTHSTRLLLSCRLEACTKMPARTPVKRLLSFLSRVQLVCLYLKGRFVALLARNSRLGTAWLVRGKSCSLVSGSADDYAWEGPRRPRSAYP